MSLPKELLDQLLTGYLDDALTSDERVRVEQLLQSNAEVADELEQLRDLRQSLQVLSRADSDIKLDQGFADRVLGAAVARAREEGLADDHPLIRLAEQPSTSPSVARPVSRSWRIAAVMVGLAASIVIAVFVLRPQTEADPSMIARVEPAPVDAQDVEVDPEVIGDADPVAAVEPGPMLVQDGVPESPTRAVESTPAIESAPVVEPNTRSVPEEAIAAASESLDVMPGATNGADRPAKTPYVYIVNVRRSEAGRMPDAVSKAMRVAGISPANRKEVTAQIAGFVDSQMEDGPDETANEDASVLYLQCPAKQFDLFYQQLWADEEGIESVRWTLATDAPLLQVVDSVRPTAVQHEAAAYELFSNNGMIAQLADELNDLNQLPPTQVGRRGAPVGLIGSGPDFQSQVLVLVR